MIASSVSANEQADQQKMVFTNSSVFVDGLEVSQLNGGYIESDISGTKVLNPNRTGWISFRLTIHEYDNGIVVLPSGQSISIIELYSLNSHQAWFWIPCEGAGCPDGGVAGQVLFSHTGKGEENRQRNFIANQLNFNLNSYLNSFLNSYSKKGELPLSAIYLSVPHPSKADQDFLHDCDSEYTCGGSSYSGHDNTDGHHSKRGGIFQETELPLFNQIDRVLQLLSVSSLKGVLGGGVLGGIPVTRSQPILSDYSLLHSKQDYYIEQVIRHRDRVILVNMLFLPITPPVPEGASPITPLQPMEVIMNWLPSVLRNANEIFAIHSRLFRAAGLSSTTIQSFNSVFITAEGELKTQELLDFWVQNLGDVLAEKLKIILTQMRFSQPEYVANAFHQCVETKDMKQGHEVITDTRRSNIHGVQHQQHGSGHSGLADLVSEKTPELFGSKDGQDTRIIGAAVSGEDGGMSVVKKDKANTSKVKGPVAKVHTLGNSGDIVIERRGTYEKDGKIVTAFGDMTSQTREHSHKKPKRDDESGGYTLGFSIQK